MLSPAAQIGSDDSERDGVFKKSLHATYFFCHPPAPSLSPLMGSSITLSGCTEELEIPLVELNGDAKGADTAEGTPLLGSELDSDSEEKEQVLFDPNDPSMARYTKHGVWDHWEDISLAPTSLFKLKLPHTIAAKIKVPRDVYRGWPYVARMLTDMATVEGSKTYFTFYLIMSTLSSVLPSLDLWYNSQFLRMIEVAVETRTVNKDALLRIAGGQVVVSVLQRGLRSLGNHLNERFDKRVGRKFASRAFRVAARLDVPTHGDSSVRQTIDSLYYYDENPLTRGSRDVVQLFSDAVNFATQCGVLFSVLQGHYEGAQFLLVVGILRLLYDIAADAAPSRSRYRGRGAYAAKTTDDDYLQKSGLESMVAQDSYRKDIVAGGLGDVVSQQYDRRMHNLSDKPTDLRHIDAVTGLARVWQIILDHAESPFDVFCQMYTCLQVVNSPSSAPFSLSTLHLVTSTVSSLNNQLSSLGRSIEGISDDVLSIRRYYETVDMPNKIPDGLTPFPENEFDLSNGISVEFKNVSFKYPDGTGKNVIDNLSFKIEQGQLCVIVGENGSGKSTILTLLTRIYDISEGQILLNGHDIRTLRLADVRKAVAVLYQEYTIFPLPFSQNIGLGDPNSLEDMDMIRQAAELGGAAEFIEELPHKYGTYLERPVYDRWDPEPSKHSAYAGKEFDFKDLKLDEGESDLSGGQKQRIALSRTFMKSIVSSENVVGLLLFDEPSAALDPKAEHDLFTRLRKLRGSKTMIFSSHRFGKLTRHADLIIYIAKGQLMEAGNHVELMKKDGEYAKFWNMQVEDFLS
ncbi:P-loop containing nucleoside triphosphate hydrolase protein [Coprinellus micaceus]|uniref:P-loop containing nucleoside triphosphate hydrolase protein n=1 Tax=Coprinellus micaceus TaxID=71717 RepID=A0A4Y7TFL8_COPMI|nr:P-loop containing nucleoside triphosphate hydrolase protein [Coprinellus micaceus]